MPAGFATYLVIGDARADHVDAHVGGRLVWAAARNLIEQDFEERKDFGVAVIAHGLDAVGGEMEGVDQADIIEVCCCRFVSEIHRMIDGQVPDREGLELGVARLDAALVIVIDLRQTRRKLSRPRPRRRHDDKVTSCLDVLVSSKTVLRDNGSRIGRIALDCAVATNFQPEPLQAVLERPRSGVGFIQLGQNNIVDEETSFAENIDEPQGIILVRNSEIRTDLLAFQILSVDDHDDLDVVDEGLEHRYFIVGREAWQDAGGMHVIEEFATHLQVELAADLLASGINLLRLERDVSFAIETNGVGQHE